mgnify:CR=1 FL=1
MNYSLVKSGASCSYCRGKGSNKVFPDDPCRDCYDFSEETCRDCQSPMIQHESCSMCNGTGEELVTVIEYLKLKHG